MLFRSLPAIGYDLSCMCDLIENGVNGFVVKRFDKEAYADFMLKIIKDKGNLKKYGENSKKKNDQLNHNHIYKKWNVILQNKKDEN